MDGISFRFRALGQSSDFLLEMIDGPMVDFHGLSETIFRRDSPLSIGSMYAIGNIYHQYSPNVSIYIYAIHGSYGLDDCPVQDFPLPCSLTFQAGRRHGEAAAGIIAASRGVAGMV